MALKNILKKLEDERRAAVETVDMLDKAIEALGGNALTCSACGFRARAPQGMSAHMKVHKKKETKVESV